MSFYFVRGATSSIMRKIQWKRLHRRRHLHRIWDWLQRRRWLHYVLMSLMYIEHIFFDCKWRKWKKPVWSQHILVSIYPVLDACRTDTHTHCWLHQRLAKFHKNVARKWHDTHHGLTLVFSSESRILTCLLIFTAKMLTAKLIFVTYLIR